MASATAVSIDRHGLFEGIALTATVLAVEAPEILALIEQNLPLVRLVTLQFRQISQPLLAEIAPAVIVTPLFKGGFDALQLAAVLCDFGYEGWLCVASPTLPNQAMVEAELCAALPRTRICVWMASRSA